MLHVAVIATDELGDRSYVAHDGTTAVVVDPQRDIDRVEEVLLELGLTVGAVLETHVHNDYVTGGLALARRTGAPYLLNADDQVAFERRGVRDEDRLDVANLSVRVVATPGHTDTHLAYLVSNGEQAPAVFTGGSLLYGSVGRTDLVAADRTEELARAQFRSARRLAAELPADAPVYPTHGFGSFCSSNTQAGGEDSTIGAERHRNAALVQPDEDAFVAELIAGLSAYPAYYAHMASRNRQGPSAPDLSPPEPVNADELGRRIAAGNWVVDLRDRRDYAAGHRAGTIGIPLGPQFSTYLGWLIPWETPLVLLGESQSQVAEAQRQLVRIGIDRPDGASITASDDSVRAGEWRSYPVAAFADLPDNTGGNEVVLDVRRADERVLGSVTGSVHVPLHELLSRTDELPPGRMWVHCASGYRASIAASLLDRAGREVVYVDDSFR